MSIYPTLTLTPDPDPDPDCNLVLQVFAGDLYGTGNGGYSTWMNFDGSGDQVQP